MSFILGFNISFVHQNNKKFWKKWKRSSQLWSPEQILSKAWFQKLRNPWILYSISLIQLEDKETNEDSPQIDLMNSVQERVWEIQFKNSQLQTYRDLKKSSIDKSQHDKQLYSLAYLFRVLFVLISSSPCPCFSLLFPRCLLCCKSSSDSSKLEKKLTKFKIEISLAVCGFPKTAFTRGARAWTLGSLTKCHVNCTILCWWASGRRPILVEIIAPDDPPENEQISTEVVADLNNCSFCGERYPLGFIVWTVNTRDMQSLSRENRLLSALFSRTEITNSWGVVVLEVPGVEHYEWKRKRREDSQ